jgi:hypothetical protein
MLRHLIFLLGLPLLAAYPVSKLIHWARILMPSSILTFSFTSKLMTLAVSC